MILVNGNPSRVSNSVMTPLVHIFRGALLCTLVLGLSNSSLRAQAATATAEVMGYSTLTIPTVGRLIAPVFVKPVVYEGIASVTASGFSVSGLTPNTLGPTSYSDRPNYPQYYLEITAGSNEGYLLDVSSNSATNVSVYNLPSWLIGQTNVSVAVRPHVTLADIASGVTGLQDSSDTVTSYGAGNTISSFVYTSGGFLRDDYVTPANNVPVYPCRGLIVNASGASSMICSGEVKPTKTVATLYVGSTLIAPLDPQGGQKVTGLGLPPALDPYNDSASLVSDSGDLGVTSYYSDGSSLLDDGYAPVNPATAPTVSVGNGIVVSTGTDRSWTNNSILNN